MTDFILDPRLEADSVLVGDGRLTQFRLHRNAAFPWLLLIPRRASVSELIDLTEDEQKILWADIAWASAVMQNLYTPKKLNVAAIGNIVPQLHVHVIARFDNDGAWPHPVWNSGIKKDYADDELDKAVSALKRALALEPAV